MLCFPGCLCRSSHPLLLHGVKLVCQACLQGGLFLEERLGESGLQCSSHGRLEQGRGGLQRHAGRRQGTLWGQRHGARASFHTGWACVWYLGRCSRRQQRRIPLLPVLTQGRQLCLQAGHVRLSLRSHVSGCSQIHLRGVQGALCRLQFPGWHSALCCKVQACDGRSIDAATPAGVLQGEEGGAVLSGRCRGVCKQHRACRAAHCTSQEVRQFGVAVGDEPGVL